MLQLSVCPYDLCIAGRFLKIFLHSQIDVGILNTICGALPCLMLASLMMYAFGERDAAAC
jgi:hypothetical protein